MPSEGIGLALVVAASVTVVIAVLAIVGVVIDRIAARHERAGDR